MASMFLPEDAEAGVKNVLAAKLADVNVASMGPTDFDDNGTLIFRPPCVRTLYVDTSYGGWQGDNQRLTYDATDHVIQVWCAAKNLVSKEAQREDTKQLVGQVVQQMAGARIALTDGSKSEPVRLVGITSLADDMIGAIYIVTLIVPGIAQFDGPNA